MSVNYDKASDYSPSKVGTPNLRFATTFLSNKYRKYAAQGESLMDKTTGEIFTKRKGDGKVVSFFQNKKYIDDILFNLRMDFLINPKFLIPDVNLAKTKEVVFLSNDYDVMSINDETDIDIKANNLVISNTDESLNSLSFRLSTQTNGFICKLITRDSDKSVIEWLTHQYDILVKKYTGTDEEILAEQAKFDDIPDWAYINATLSYTVTIVKSGSVTTYECIGYANLNSDSVILFPTEDGNEYYTGADKISVKINSVNFDKIQFIINRGAELSDTFVESLNKLIAYDKMIYLRYITMEFFVDKFEDYNIIGNENIVALVDIFRLYNYMNNASKMISSSPVILSPNMPALDAWDTHCIWAEQVSKTYQGGAIVEMDHEVDINTLEEYIANTNSTRLVNYTENSEDEDNILLSAKTEEG